MRKVNTVSDVLAKVARGHDDECWPWLGGMARTGYGQMAWRGEMRTAHALIYELMVGEIPTVPSRLGRRRRLSICHRCDNPVCCNPAHLFLGTQADNINDAVKKGRHFASGEVRLAVQQWVGGEPASVLARRLGVSRQRVHQLLKGYKSPRNTSPREFSEKP